jgi:excisionase family DNA binding protein
MRYETGIYGVVNQLRSCVYVGATKRSFRERWDSHRMALDNRTHFNLPLQRDWLRDGSDHFAFLILDELPSSYLMAHFEQSWIDGFHDAGVGCYNTAQAIESLRQPIPPSIALPDDHEWMTVDEVAHSLRVSIRTILRWIDAQHLAAVLLQGRYRISLETMKLFMTQDRPHASKTPVLNRHRSRLALYDIVIYDRHSWRVDQIAGRNLPWNDAELSAAQRLKTVIGHISDRHAAALTDANRYQPGDVFDEASSLSPMPIVPQEVGG